MRSSRIGIIFGLALSLSACFAPPSRATLVTDAARELNLATRFGRMDLAVARTARGARDHFVERRADWGSKIRVVDVELAGLSMKGADDALIHVDVAWVRVSEGVFGPLESLRYGKTGRALGNSSAKSECRGIWAYSER